MQTKVQNENNKKAYKTTKNLKGDKKKSLEQKEKHNNKRKNIKN